MKKWEQEVTNSSLRLMNILLEEEKIYLEKTNTKLKETIERAHTLRGEIDFNKKELELQNQIDRFTCLLKERKHQQFIKDLAYTLLAYTLLNRTQQRGLDLEISSSDTELTDSERQRKSNRSPYRTIFRNK